MSNIADMIESYILRQLASRQDGQVELRRTDIADEISCAPSQISYLRDLLRIKGLSLSHGAGLVDLFALYRFRSRILSIRICLPKLMSPRIWRQCSP